jgi:hypothetical protein
MDPTLKLVTILPPGVETTPLTIEDYPLPFLTKYSNNQYTTGDNIVIGKGRSTEEGPEEGIVEGVVEEEEGEQPSPQPSLTSVLLSGPFRNQGALKMADMDAVYTLTGHLGGTYRIRDDDSRFRYACLCESPGGFVEYLQFRSSRSYGYGISFGDDVWDLDAIDLDRFEMVEDDSDTGDLTEQWKYFANYVIKKTAVGVMLCTADAEDTQDHKVVLVEVLTGLMVVAGAYQAGEELSPGGHFILRMGDTKQQVWKDVIFVLTQCFLEVSLLRPVVGDNVYVACRYCLADDLVDPWIQLLGRVVDSYDGLTAGSSVVSFLPQLPVAYLDWLKGQRRAVESSLEQGVRYDPGRCLLAWNLPTRVG